MATVTIYADAADNVIRSSSSSSYSLAHNTFDTVFGATSTTQGVADYDSGVSGWYTQQGFESWDSTGILQSGDTISAASIQLKKSATSDDPGTIPVMVYDWGTAVDSGDFRNVSALQALSVAATLAPNSIGVGSYVVSTDLASSVIKNGWTRVVIAMASQRNDTAPPSSPTLPSFSYYAADQTGTTDDPILVVTYTRTTIQTVGGGGTPTGTAVRTTKKNPSGAATPGGAVVRQALHKLAGSIASAGAAVRNKTTAKALTGTIANAGAVVRRAAKSLAAGITPTGAMTRVASFIRALAGAITPTGNASRTLSRALVASIASSGAVARAMRYARNLAGTIASAGTLYRYTDRMPDSDIAAGTWVSTEATLFAAINETLTNDATYITSAASPLDDTAIVGVAPLGIPATGPVTLIVRALQV